MLKVGAVSFGIFNESENKALPSHVSPLPRYEVKADDLLISRANIARLVGACALVHTTRAKLMLCDKIFRVVWKDGGNIMPAYLDEAMKIPHLRQQIENALTGTSPTMKNISKPALLALRLPLPPADVQEKIVRSIGNDRTRVATLRAQAEASRAQALAQVEAAILGSQRPAPAE